jgi:hypothetical protein
MTTTPNANRKTASKKTTRRIARKFTSNFTRKKARAISRRKQLEMKAALERHSRKCIICHHPEREAIEEEFLHWRAPGSSLKTTISPTIAPSIGTPALPAFSSSGAKICTPGSTPSSKRSTT